MWPSGGSWPEPTRPDSLHLNLHDRPGSVLFGRRTQTLHGPARLREEVAGVAFLVSPTAFFQTNIEAADTLVRLVLAAVPSGPCRVLDLYAGAGLFSLPLARGGHDVTAVEERPRGGGRWPRQPAAEPHRARGVPLHGRPRGRCRRGGIRRATAAGPDRTGWSSTHREPGARQACCEGCSG